MGTGILNQFDFRFLTGYPVAILRIFIISSGLNSRVDLCKSAHKTIKDALPFAPF